MPFIQNVPRINVELGAHWDPTPQSVLIQICDIDKEHPSSKFTFDKVFKFKFNDVTYDDEPGAITDDQAKLLVEILRDAIETNSNVIVHCTAGICRSGAVAEIGTIMGFTETPSPRIPNILVKTKMLRILGWSYD